MRARQATFITSAAQPAQFPAQELPEIAFAGRSNVGKSSLINTLVGVTRLARTSSTPGRTRLLNWFRIEHDGGAIAFVDLPGYGYAKVSKDLRQSWRPLIEAYLGKRQVLRACVVLVDARRGARDEEAELVEWLGANDIPVIAVLTKGDKLPKNKRKPAAAALQRELGLDRPPVVFSAQEPFGVDDLWREIHRRLRPSSD
jgi:GTP-binding protein